LPHTASLTPSTAINELDHRVPRCLAVGDYDGDDNLWPQPRAEALVKDDMEAEVCRLVCQFRTMPIENAVELFADWRAGYRIVVGMRHERNGVVDADLNNAARRLRPDEFGRSAGSHAPMEEEPCGNHRGKHQH
jgi:hypothetical protein